MSTLAIGLMSGTSLDGVDAALVRILDERRVELLAFCTLRYEAEDRTALQQLTSDGSVRDVTLWHVKLGHRFADAAERVLREGRIERSSVGFVACHGQTVWHEPGNATLQIGDPAVIAERLGLMVVSDFRSRDVAAGGQGAPLVPLADAMLFGHAERGRALLNLGGMANVTWVPRAGTVDGVLAFDTGPGVAVMDGIARRFDPARPYDVGGAAARRGRVASQVVDELLRDPYFEQPPPKSTGRERFGQAFAEMLVERVTAAQGDVTGADSIATALELTARSIADQIERWVTPVAGCDLLLSGGGARNPVLVERLGALLGGWNVRRFGDEFFDGDAKEAVAFAYLGWRTLEGLPGNVPSATGATGSRLLGRVTPP